MAQIYETKTAEGHLGLPFEVIRGPLNFARPVSFSTTHSKVHPDTTGVAVLKQMRLDDVEVSLRKLGGGIGGANSGGVYCEAALARSSIPPSRRNSRPRAPGQRSRSSSRTDSSDDDVLSMMATSFSGPSPAGGIRRGSKRNSFRTRLRWEMRIWYRRPS